MSKKSRSILLLLFITGSVIAQTSHGYHIDNAVRINRSDCASLSTLSVLIPMPQTDQYQTISATSFPGGQLLNCPNSPDQYIRFYFTSGQLSGIGNVFDLTVSFDAILHPVVFDFNQVSTIYPYNTTSPEYQQNIGASGIYVVPDNATINAIAQSIWSTSSDIVDYARKCYEYVAQNYDYLNPYTGLHPLAEILANGGGDCGNLTSIYVSLLRNKSIPSRHVVTIRPNGTYHVWAEFYLENYGWIPVDVTYKQSDPYGNYFGNYDGNGIVVSKGVCLTLERTPGDTYTCAFFQTYEWWYWYSSTCNNITSQHIVTSSNPVLYHTITATADDNGSITPAGSIIVPHNSTQAFEMIPNDGYEVQEVYVDGNPFGSMTSYSFPNVTASHTIHVSFARPDAVNESNDDKILGINVFSTTGQKLMSKTLNTDRLESIHLDGLPDGIYLLQIIREKGTITKQIIKIH